MGEEDEWLAILDASDPDRELAPGLTAAACRAFHVRPPTPVGATFTSDIRYVPGAPGRRPVLHVFGRRDSTDRAPGVVLVHGGGWSGGHPFHQIRYAHGFAAAGYVVAMVSYRLGRDGRWPAALEDVVAAMRWLRAHQDRFGLDPDRLAAGGDSAGGHLVAMAALGGVELSALALWYPVLDLRHGRVTGELDPAVVAFLPDHDAAARAAASPLATTMTRFPPTVTIVGGDDAVTPAALAAQLHARLDARAIVNELHVIEGAPHAFDLRPAAWPQAFELARSFLDRLV